MGMTNDLDHNRDFMQGGGMNRTKQGQTPRRAVVLGMGINGLALARSLGRQGVGVQGVYVRDDEIGRQSRYCGAVRFPSLKDGDEAFLRKLTDELGDRKTKPVLYSESDQYIMFMSQNRDRLRDHFEFLLPDAGLLETLVSKERSAFFVAGKGFPIPDTYYWGGVGGMKEIPSSLAYPCIMKPIDSFSTRFVKKNAIFADRSALELFLKERPELSGHVIIQNIIPGGDSNTFQATTYVSKAGEILPIFTMRKTRQCPPDFGVTSYGVSEDVPYLREKVHGLLTAIQYRGFISIEFKQHPHTGEWLYIETNPRLPYYHALMYDSGINYPYLYYRDMTDAPADSCSEVHQRDGVIWICLGRDLESFATKVLRRQITTFPWLVSLLKARSFALLDFSDLRPFLVSGFYFIRLAAAKLLKTVSRGFSLFSRKKEKPAGPCSRISDTFRDHKT